jgi:cytoskeletal protein CcmA (bactofilin family)
MRYLATILLFIMISVFCISAAQYIGANSVRINSGDSVNTDLVTGSRYVDVDGYLKGDLYAGAEKIVVQGQVNDDVLAGARDLLIQGKVADMVIGFGQYVLIDGDIGGDVISFGGEVRITSRAHVHGNVYVRAGSFQLENGQIDGWLKGGAEKIHLDGQVGEKVNLEANEVVFGENYLATQGTELKLSYPLNPEKAGNVPANVEITYTKKHPFFKSFGFYWTFFALLITGILLSVLFKNFVRNIITFAQSNFWKNLGFGFLFLIIIPAVIVILLVLFFTIPVALILLALYFMALYLSAIISGIFIGRYFLAMLHEEKSQLSLIWSLLVGLIIIVLVAKIPVIGFFSKVVVVSFGLGSFIVYLWNMKKLKTSE